MSKSVDEIDLRKSEERDKSQRGDNPKKFHLKNGNKKKFYLCFFFFLEAPVFFT
jgi:hypothetical protein